MALDQASKTSGYSVYKDGQLHAYGKFTFEDADLGERLCKIKNKSGTTFKNKIPPHELAINKLVELNSLKLCENGCEKEYYTKISEIIREYLANRFGINALEMTTAQIKYAVKQSDGASISKKYIEIVLEMADFVKFAKVRPLPEDNMRTYQAALQYVHDTKSVEIDENNKNAE